MIVIFEKINKKSSILYLMKIKKRIFSAINYAHSILLVGYLQEISIKYELKKYLNIKEA